MQPSDRSKGPPKMTIGPLPTPPGGARPPQTPPAAPRGAPAVGTGILSGSGLNFGPAYVPPRRQPALQGQPVLVTVPKPAPPRPAAPRPAAAMPAPPKPAAPLPEPVVEPKAEEPGPPPAWMAEQSAGAKGPNRGPLLIGGAAIVVVAAVAAVALLRPHAPEPTPAPTLIEQPAPAALEPLRPQQEIASAEVSPILTPEPARKPASKARRTETPETAAVEPAPTPVAAVPPPVQVNPQPLAIAPPPAPVQQPPPRIIIPHLDPSAPIVTRSSADQ